MKQHTNDERRMIQIQQTTSEGQKKGSLIQLTDGTFSCLKCDTRKLVLPYQNTMRIDHYTVSWESATARGPDKFVFSPSESFSGFQKCRFKPSTWSWKISKYMIKPSSHAWISKWRGINFWWFFGTQPIGGGGRSYIKLLGMLDIPWKG